MRHEYVYKKLLSIFMDAVREEVRKTSIAEAARKCGVDPSTVSKWISGERGGERLYAKHLISSLFGLGMSMEALLKHFSPDSAAEVVSALDAEPDLMESIIRILNGPDQAAKDKLRAEIKYIEQRS